MSNPSEDNVSDATRSTEAEDEQVHSGADRAPTPEEEAAAVRGRVRETAIGRALGGCGLLEDALTMARQRLERDRDACLFLAAQSLLPSPERLSVRREGDARKCADPCWRQG